MNRQFIIEGVKINDKCYYTCKCKFITKALFPPLRLIKFEVVAMNSLWPGCEQTLLLS